MELPEISGSALILYNAFIWFKRYKLLPAPGTWTEQTVKFLSAVEWIEQMNDTFAIRKNEANQRTQEFLSKGKKCKKTQ